ncbi:Uncharacterised protein [Bordetella pertussis]|nr:Uncharacterised protein [Bordetella pertussis]
MTAKAVSVSAGAGALAQLTSPTRASGGLAVK